MTPPDSVQIGPVRYAVLVEEDLHTFSSEWVKQHLLGNITYKDAEIRLTAESSPEVQRVILLHEVLHGCFDQINIEHEEETVQALAFILLDTMRRNPQLISYLTGVADVALEE